MSKIDDGGPAFPDTGLDCGPRHGMSLRDYFAATCHQPGTHEVYQIAGCPEGVKPPTEEFGSNWKADDKRPTVAEWWAGLSVDEKYRLYSVARYRIADAMLSARKAVQP